MSQNLSKFLCLILGLTSLTVQPSISFAQGKSSALLEEVIVTARKREESLQDAPVAISAFTGDSLEFRGVTDIGRLDEFSPNLVINKSPTNSNVTNAAVYIRGIGQNDFVPVIDPGVGIYVDGVYLGRSVGGILDIVDLERVEVLRGPQGTLFGRNTIGGAVSLHSKKPDEELGGKVDIKFGTDALMQARGTVNVPITDTLFTRFSVASFQQDGYVTRVFDGLDLGNDDTLSARGSARWLATDNVEINVSLDYSRDRENGNPFVLTGVQPINAGLFFADGTPNPDGGPSMTLANNTLRAQIISNPAALGTGGGAFFDPTLPFPFLFTECLTPANANNPLCFNQQFIDNGDRKLNFGTFRSEQKLDSWGGSISVDWDINDNLKVKSISSLRGFEGFFAGDQDGSPLRITELDDIYQHNQFTQELQLLGTSFDDKLDWIIGAFYFEEDGKNINPVFFSQVSLQSGGEYDADSWAIFSQGTYHFNDKLDITFGLRYTEDTRRYLPDQFVTEIPLGPLPTRAAGATNGGVNCPALDPGVLGPGTPCLPGDRVLPFQQVSRSTSELVPMVNIAYQWTDSLMTYATYSEGFKSGGFTQRIFPPETSLPDFEPEFVESYEVGFKFDGWDNKLRFNFAAFYTDYSDLQLLVTDPGRVGPFVSNAGDAEIIGIEAEMFLTPAEGWFISASLGLTDADRKNVGTAVAGLTNDSRFEHISKWTASAQLYKEFPMGEWGYLTPRIEWSYRSKFGTNSNNVPRDGAPTFTAGPLAGVPLSFGLDNPALVQPGYHLLNVSMRWDVMQTGLSFSAGIDNVTDKEYRLFGNFQDSFAETIETFDRGRQWYISGSFEF